MGTFSNENKSKLKDEMRLNMFFLRSIISKFQVMVEDCLTFVLNECYVDIIAYLNKDVKRVKGQPQDIEKIRVELDPIQYITSEEIDLFKEKGVTLENIIKVILGDEFLFLAKDLEPTSEKEGGEKGKKEEGILTLLNDIMIYLKKIVKKKEEGKKE